MEIIGVFRATANSPFPRVTEIYALWYTLNLGLFITAVVSCQLLCQISQFPPQIPVSSQKLPMIANDFA